jgi:rare lipoprotein A (peptidoglycan hydrolase)
VTDRGPFVRGRIIDLTPVGIRALGISALGHVTVQRL